MASVFLKLASFMPGASPLVQRMREFRHRFVALENKIADYQDMSVLPLQD